MKHSTTEELRNAMGKLVGKLYQHKDKTEIEIVIKGCRSRFILPAGTPIRFDPGALLTK